MKPQAKQLILEHYEGNATQSNIVATADISGFDQLFVSVRANVGTVNDADETAQITVDVRDYTSTNDGDTAYTTVVGTTEFAAFAVASASSVVTEKTLSLSRGNLQTHARYLQVTVDKSATGANSQVWLSVVGLRPSDGQVPDYSV